MPIIKPLQGFDALREQLAQALEEALPQSLGDSSTIRSTFDNELSTLRSLTQESEPITEFEQAEQIATGIKNLKVKCHGTLGYCIEVTKTNAPLVPSALHTPPIHNEPRAIHHSSFKRARSGCIFSKR